MRSRYERYDSSYLKNILKELDSGNAPNRRVVKLPCKDVTVEMGKPEDQYIKCPVCNKAFLITWSRVNRQRMKWHERN